MTFSAEQKSHLAADLLRIHVKERKQSGRTLSYIEGWHAIAEANRIFGFDAWMRETMDIRMVAERERKLASGKDGWSVSYVAKVRVTVGSIVREGIGAGHGIDADLGLAHESASKEAETDAMKRALTTFGNPFGLALYDKTQANVAEEAPPLSPAAERALLILRDCATRPSLEAMWKEKSMLFARHTNDAEFAMLKAEYERLREILPAEKEAV